MLPQPGLGLQGLLELSAVAGELGGISAECCRLRYLCVLQIKSGNPGLQKLLLGAFGLPFGLGAWLLRRA